MEMEMSAKMCRLCLADSNLKPIFMDLAKDKVVRYTFVLTLTTGLKIELNDGLPQYICTNCAKSVNLALNLRNRSRLAELKLLNLGFKKIMQNENIDNKENINSSSVTRTSVKVFIEKQEALSDDNESRNEDVKIEVHSHRTHDENSLEVEKRNTKEKSNSDLEDVDRGFDDNVDDFKEVSEVTDVSNADDADLKRKKKVKTVTFQLNVNKEVDSDSETDVADEFFDEIHDVIPTPSDVGHVKVYNLYSEHSEEHKNKVRRRRKNAEQKNKKLTLKERREMYVSYVDGVLDMGGPIRCRLCKTSVSKWVCFMAHVKRKHKTYPYLCEFCGRGLTLLTELNLHLRRFHGKKRDAACNLCGYLALDKKQLLLHERRCHTGERPFICNECGAAFMSRNGLVQHLDFHLTTEPTVKCDKCPEKFRSRRMLCRHKYTVHKRRSAVCPVCSRTFTRKYLAKHLTTHKESEEGIEEE